MSGGRNNYIGFVYSFQSIGKYYLALWKKGKSSLTSFNAERVIEAPKGFHVKASLYSLLLSPLIISMVFS